MNKDTKNMKRNPKETANLLSQFFFWYVKFDIEAKETKENLFFFILIKMEASIFSSSRAKIFLLPEDLMFLLRRSIFFSGKRKCHIKSVIS